MQRDEPVAPPIVAVDGGTPAEEGLSRLPRDARVVLYGDSLTEGYSGPDGPKIRNGFRPALDRAAIAAGFTSLRYLGTQDGGPGVYAPTRLHEGIIGDCATTKLLTLDALFGAQGKISNVDLFVVGLSTNAEKPPGGTKGWMQFHDPALQVFLALHELQPRARFVVWPAFSGAGVRFTLPQWDQLVPELRAAGLLVYFIVTKDQAIEVVDGVHPTDPAGYERLGRVLTPGFVAALEGAPPGTY